MELVVQKFGGTSVGTIERIRHVAAHVKETLSRQQNIVVVSAMAGETNRLVDLARQMTPNPQLQAYDMLVASGEQVSCALLAMALEDLGVKAMPMLGFQAGLRTDDLFSKARIQGLESDVLTRCVKDGIVPVVAGFQGIHKDDDEEGFPPRITTLGRGGSDTSAVAIAIGVQAARCDIYTDVDGVYTADPRIVPGAHRIDKISFAEMMELASLGAKVLHMRSVELAAKYRMKLRVLSTFAPERGGTTLVEEEEMMLESPVVSSITADAAECLLTLHAPENEARFPAKFFKPLAAAGINVDVIVQTPADAKGDCTISFTVPRDEGRKAAELLARYRATIARESTLKVSIVGIGMRTHSGVAARMFETLEKQGIPMHLITTSEIKVSVLIDEHQKEAAIRSLHETFGL